MPNRSPNQIKLFSLKSLIAQMAKSNTEHKMINTYLKPLEFFKELLKEHDESPYPVLLCLYVSDNHVSLAESDEYYLAAHCRGLYPRGNLDDLVEELQSLQKLAGPNLRGIIVASNNSVAPPVNIHTLMNELCKKGNFESLKCTYLTDRFKSMRTDQSGITFPSRPPWCPKPCGLKEYSAVRMLQVGLDFINTLIDRRTFCEGEEDS